MRAIIVGARGATRDLLRRLSERWRITVIDSDPELLARARAVREIESHTGDGSSKVVLERAGLTDTDAVVAATVDDAVNLEVCRLAIAAGVYRVVAVAADPERVPEYRDLGVPAFAPDSLTARQVETSLEPRKITSTTFADGKAEAIEFRIAPDSPVRGTALRNLHSESYLVAAVLRDGNLIVPHGDTVLEAGDLVTVVGASADFSNLVRTFTSGEARFPLDFGKGVLVALQAGPAFESVLAEALELTRNSPAEELVVTYRDLESISDEGEGRKLEAALDGVRAAAEGIDLRLHPVAADPTRAMGTVIQDESIGVVVVPTPPPDKVGRIRAVRMLRRTQPWNRPVLFARGSQPYQRIVAPARQTPAGTAAARAAIDLAGDGRAAVTGVAVVSPAFVTGSDDRETAVRALARMREEAAVLDVPVRRLLRQGNPVRVIQAAVGGADLLVLGFPGRRPTFFAPGIVPHLLERVEVSLLVVPDSP
jgi:Trk K+ transport system NAD-binding subunit